MRLALALLLALIPSLSLAAEPAPAPLFDDNGTPLSIAQFVEKYIPADMPEGLGRKEVQAALEDAGANWVELADVFWRTSDEGKIPEEAAIFHNAAWLITKAPHLDRLELGADQLFSVLISAMLEIEAHGYDPASDLYRRYVLNYRFDDEPVSSWSRDFATDYFFITPTDDAEIEKHGRPSPYEIQAIVKRAAAGFKVLDRGYFGNLSDPLSLYSSGAGSKRELSILVAAALRSQGYATRFVRENRSGESWVEVYSGDPRSYDPQAWTPVYPTAPDKTGDIGYATELCGGRICVVTAGDAFGREQVTGRYMPLGYVAPKFVRSGPDGPVADADFAGWAVTAWNDATGSFVSLDDLEYPSGDKDYPLDTAQPKPEQGVYALGPGEYRIEWGVRYPGGITHVQTREFKLQHAQQLALEQSLNPPADLPQAALVEREIGEFRDSHLLKHEGAYLFIVGDREEPTTRISEMLLELHEGKDFGWQLYLPKETTSEQALSFVKDVLKVDWENDPLPVVIVVVDGATKLYLRGYNLNVAQWVERALEVNNVE